MSQASTVARAVAVVGAIACADDVELRPGLGTPPLRDAELAGCEVVGTTRVFGVPLATEEWSYDGEGQRRDVRYDDDADGADDRVHRDTWAGGELVRTEATEAEDDDYAFLETFVYSESTVASRRVSYDRAGEGGRERTDTLFEYRYDLGLLQSIREDVGVDGAVDAVARFTWADDLSSHREVREGVTWRRTFDLFGRAIEQVESGVDDGAVPVAVSTLTYDAEHIPWLSHVFVDFDGDGGVELTVDWDYACR